MIFDWLTIIGIIGTVASIIGLPYAYILTRRSDRKKILTYYVTSPPRFIDFPQEWIEHRPIVYTRVGAKPIYLEGAYLSFLLIGNLGKETINKEDIAPNDPIRIEVSGAKVVDIAKTSISRKEINFSLSSFKEVRNSITVSNLVFDFLDYEDGAQIRILTDSDKACVRVVGTVIGMPNGIIQKCKLKKPGFIFYFLLWISNIVWAASAFALVFLIIWLVPSFRGMGEVTAFLLTITVMVVTGIITSWFFLVKLANKVRTYKEWPETLTFPSWFKESAFLTRSDYYNQLETYLPCHELERLL